ncbi:AMP-binding protein [Streptomyces sp. CNQ085]|uniref:AMP-binding protein n=1 Tax=Streptomyces sp. CNQ085 TaxID=2886944 RepID=UPI001F51336F|nr:AMP-binding protein [Streptomyces sp. CNQ085]MCI0383180.1 AMP-binding protein [Streptomyces sp. CNQ085]
MAETAHLYRAYAVTGGLDERALHTAWRGTTARYAVPGRDPFGFTNLGEIPDPGPWRAATRLRADPDLLPPAAAPGPAARLVVARTAEDTHLVMVWVNQDFADRHSPADLISDLGAACRAAPGGRAGDFCGAGFDWSAALSPPLAALCSREGTTPLDVLLAAYSCLLNRHTGEERPVIGVLEPDGGHRTVLADLTGQPSFRELVARMAGSRRTAGSPANRPARYDALFRAENPAEPLLGLPGARVHRLRSDDGVPDTDLALTVRCSPSHVSGRLEYRTVPFDAAAASGLLGQLRTLLRAALDAPGTPADTLPLETPGQLRAAAREADRIAAGVWSGRPVHTQVRAVARSRPDSLALDDGGEGVTYRELWEEAEAVERALRALDTEEGSPVALRLPNGPHRAAALLGVFGAGTHAVCLGTGLSGERGRAVLSELRPHCLLVESRAEDSPLVSWFGEEAGGHVVDVIGLAPPRETPASPGLPVRAAPAEGDVCPPAPEGAGPAGRWAYIAYTSGSTGLPKGIPQSHRTLAQFVEWFTTEFGIGPGSRVAQWSAPGYDAGLVELFAALTTGATLCPVPDRYRANPEKLADWLRTERITHLQTVPSFARRLLAAIREAAPLRPVSLSHLLLAGEAFPGELADGLREVLPGVRLVNLYGATETVLATWHEVDGPVRGTVPIGRPIPGRQVLVLDEHGRPCPAGVTGRVVVCGPHVTPGYVGAAPGDAFRPLAGAPGTGIAGGPCHRTGDLGRRRWDGLLEYAGRGDSRVKILGTRLELTDVEARLVADETVADCAVVARTGEDGLVRHLTAYVVPRRPAEGGAALPARAWRSGLRRWFGQALPPVSFVAVEELPRGPGGKVDRHALAAGAGPAPGARAAKAI